jgi:hypothetical protein
MTVLELILTDEEVKEKFKEEFLKTAVALGETVIQPIDADQIISIINKQGYWSGVTYRIHWNLQNGFYVEPKRYGR